MKISNALASMLVVVIGSWMFIQQLPANTHAPITPPNKQTNKTSEQLLIPSHAVVLLYHHVDNDTPTLTSISPQHFQQQLDYLAENNFQVWPLETVIQQLKTAQPIPDKVVAITFDDSYQSVYKTAFPLLRQRQWPFTVFIATEAIDQSYNLQTSWSQLREMAAAGATIANHSNSHQHLLKKQSHESAMAWRQRITRDIEQAEQRILEEIGYSKKLFAYPYGEYNKTLSELVTALGYTAFGQHSGPIGEHSDFSQLPRFPFAGQYTELESFALKVMTVPLQTKSSAPDNPLPHGNSRPQLKLQLLSPLQQPQSLQCFASSQGKIPLEWTSSHTVVMTPAEEIPPGRSRFNCTAAFSGSDEQTRYYWHSYPWIRLDKGEQWVLD